MAFGFDLGSIAKGVMDNVSNTPTKTTSSNSGLSNSTVSSGLKEALKVGVDYAVKSLGANNGYLNNSLVKIPLPENLKKSRRINKNCGWR